MNLDDHVPLSIDFREKVQKITYRPPNKEFDPEWGITVLDGMKEYLVVNPVTSEGRNSIADFNGFHKEWDVKCNEFNDATPICDINFELARIYTKHPTHHNVFSVFERRPTHIGRHHTSLHRPQIE